MKDRVQLASILNDIREKTGTDVRLAPHGGRETRFTVEYLGTQTSVWVDGDEAETCAVRRLVAYLIENTDPARFEPERDELLKSILLGEGGGWQAFRFMTKYNLPDAPCFAADVVPEKNLSEAAAHVERCLEGGQDLCAVMDGTRLAIVKFSDDGQTPYEFGQFIVQSLYEELGIKATLGIGCEAKSFSEISVSYHQAATATRMSEIFEAKGEVHTYREYLLVRMLEDIPKPQLNEYMAQFRIGNAEELFEDAEMSSTAEEFLENSLNISETSRNLYMHRNTLMYRLDKIERITGLNIRKFSDAVTFRVISILYKLLQK